VVLDLREVAAVLANLSPTCQLAAKLQYGSGLRIRELVNLRIKDVDLERLQVSVRGGKGDQDRVTTLPESLVAELRAWKEKVRVLHEKDRTAGLPGVALPNGLRRGQSKNSENRATSGRNGPKQVLRIPSLPKRPRLFSSFTSPEFDRFDLDGRLIGRRKIDPDKSRFAVYRQVERDVLPILTT
ncbi:MAG: tyrosine-type recombinase/integrase, partial [Verrucomicrobiae bacterium]|nr:tyrosine-type recombinase/integrase [Verrucomicrobiae bacterium]